MNNPTFALDIKSLVVKAYVSSKVARSQGNGAILFTSAEELLADRNITGKILVDAFNEVSIKTVKKFSDNKTFAGKKIRVIELGNPRKEGTRAHKTYSLYFSCDSYEDLVARSAGWSTKGGVREDVAHDIKKGRIELI